MLYLLEGGGSGVGCGSGKSKGLCRCALEKKFLLGSSEFTL